MKRKVNDVEYSKSMLPRTRKAQFGDVFKNSYITILRCGFILLAFFIPMIAASIFMDFYYLSILANVTEGLTETILIWNYIFNGAIVLTSLIAVLGVTVVIRIIRNLIWGEGSFLKDDFVNSIKQNSLRNILFTLVIGALYCLTYYLFTFLSYDLASYLAIGIFGVIFVPFYFWALLINNTYDMKNGDLIKNSLFFYLKTFGFSFIGLLMTISYLGVLFIPLNFIYIKYSVVVILIIFVYPIMLLVFVLFSTAKFDYFINKDNYKDYYLRGLNDN